MSAYPTEAEGPARSRRVLAWAGAIGLALLFLLGPALWNGFPLLQYDTGGYLARWYEGYLVPSRPGAYALLLLLGARHAFWPVVVVQAALSIWIVAVVLRVHGLGGRPRLLLVTVAALSALTTLPWIASVLLTDIFVGLAVLGLHLLVFLPDRLRRWEKPALAALIAFAGATHSATLGLLVAMAGAVAVTRLLWRGAIPRGGVTRAAAIAALCVVATLAGNFAVAGRIAWTPGGYGILFGRMLQEGLVTRYLDAHCPTTPFKLCPYRAELPRDADAFLWGQSAFNTLGRFDGLGEEMRSIVLGCLRDYPREQIEGALGGALTQLVRVGTGEGVIDALWHTYAIIARYTPAALPAMRAARQQQGTLQFESINRVHIPVAILGLLLLPLAAMLGLRDAAFADYGRLAATVAVAVLVNAAVCGMLANPHNRYGARIVWLAPMVGVLGLALAHDRRRGTAAAGAPALFAQPQEALVPARRDPPP